MMACLFSYPHLQVISLAGFSRIFSRTSFFTHTFTRATLHCNMRPLLLVLVPTVVLASSSSAQHSSSESNTSYEEAPSWIWLFPSALSTPKGIVTITIFVHPSKSLSAGETRFSSDFSTSKAAISFPEIVPVTVGPASTDVITTRTVPTSKLSKTASALSLETSLTSSSAKTGVYTTPTFQPAAPSAHSAAINRHPGWDLVYMAMLFWFRVLYCCI